MSEEMVDVVDEEDNVIGIVSWKKMMDKALLHRSANIMVLNSKGELFVHKRAPNVRLYPSSYDVKFGGSVNAGESYEDCAKRELYEETKIKSPKLEFLFSLKFRSDKNNTNRKVFKCIYDGELKLDEKEIESGEFMKIKDAKKLMEEGKFSPSGKKVFDEFLKKVD